MKIRLLLLLLFSNLTLVFAQEKITITGQLIEDSSNELFSFTNVSVINTATNILVTGAITDENGRFNILDLPLGKYRINFSFIGYSPEEQKLTASGLNTIFDSFNAI